MHCVLLLLRESSSQSCSLSHQTKKNNKNNLKRTTRQGERRDDRSDRESRDRRGGAPGPRSFRRLLFPELPRGPRPSALARGSVFRALTRLRGAALASFDGIAPSPARLCSHMLRWLSAVSADLAVKTNWDPMMFTGGTIWILTHSHLWPPGGPECLVRCQGQSSPAQHPGAHASEPKSFVIPLHGPTDNADGLCRHLELTHPISLACLYFP